MWFYGASDVLKSGISSWGARKAVNFVDPGADVDAMTEAEVYRAYQDWVNDPDTEDSAARYLLSKLMRNSVWPLFAIWVLLVLWVVLYAFMGQTLIKPFLLRALRVAQMAGFCVGGARRRRRKKKKKRSNKVADGGGGGEEAEGYDAGMDEDSDEDNNAEFVSTKVHRKLPFTEVFAIKEDNLRRKLTQKEVDGGWSLVRVHAKLGAEAGNTDDDVVDDGNIAETMYLVCQQPAEDLADQGGAAAGGGRAAPRGHTTTVAGAAQRKKLEAHDSKVTHGQDLLGGAKVSGEWRRTWQVIEQQASVFSYRIQKNPSFRATLRAQRAADKAVFKRKAKHHKRMTQHKLRAFAAGPSPSASGPLRSDVLNAVKEDGAARTPEPAASKAPAAAAAAQRADAAPADAQAEAVARAMAATEEWNKDHPDSGLDEDDDPFDPFGD